MVYRHQFSLRSHQPDDAWASALADLRAAQARFAPVLDALAQAERAYFSRRGKPDKNAAPDPAVEAQLNQAYEDERIQGAALNEAAKAFFRLRAPNLAALIEKLELMQAIGYEECLEQLVIEDLRYLQASG